MESSKSTFGRLGLLAIVAIFIIAVSLSNLLFRGIRVDLTENQLFTLSDGTIRILEDISEPINLYFFFSDRATADTPVLRMYAVRVREMLQEFAPQVKIRGELAASERNIAIERDEQSPLS